MPDEPKTEPKKPVDREAMRAYVLPYPAWFRPFVWTEWGMKWVAYGLSELAIFTLIEYIGKLSIVVAVIFYFLEAPTRRKQAQYDAWRVITAYEGKAGNGGRIQALQDLNNSRVNLSGVDLEKAFLGGIKLSDATLRDAIFRDANLREGDLARADLRGADLTGAILLGTDLSDADLSGAKLANAKLTGARLIGASLEGADLQDAVFRGVFRTGSSSYDFANCDLSKSKGLIQGQINSAKGDSQTILPERLSRPDSWTSITAPAR